MFILSLRFQASPAILLHSVFSGHIDWLFDPTDIASIVCPYHLAIEQRRSCSHPQTTQLALWVFALFGAAFGALGFGTAFGTTCGTALAQPLLLVVCPVPTLTDRTDDRPLILIQTFILAHVLTFIAVFMPLPAPSCSPFFSAAAPDAAKAAGATAYETPSLDRVRCVACGLHFTDMVYLVQAATSCY